MPAGAEARDVLGKQMATIRANNQWFWKQCTKRGGVSEHVPVRLRANFGTRGDEAQARLVAALGERGYRIVNIGQRDSLTETLFETPAQRWDLPGWNLWTDEMFLLGAELDFALFGGITEAIVDRPDNDAIAEAKAEQRAGNPATWKALRARGVTADTPIALDAHFWAINEGSALRLQDRLQSELGYSTGIDPPRRGLFRQAGPWSVSGTRPAQRTNEADIDSWTDRMVEVADSTGTRFDGWGTWLPD